LAGILAGSILVIATACGGGGSTPKPAASTAASVPAASVAAASCAAGTGTGQQVGIANRAFNPATLTVSAGSTVTWTNADAATHSVTFDNGPDCGNLATGASTTVTFSAAGSYPYHCKIHPSMTGSITVS
jgi:plastocyanin